MAEVEVDDQGAVRVFWMNRPARRNALSAGLLTELRTQLERAGQDDAVHAVVLTGRGGTFCAGGDLSDGLAAAGALSGHAARGLAADFIGWLPTLPIPVIAAVEGAALGGGCGLAAACDLVVAADDARFGLPEIKLGLFPWIVLSALQRDVPRKILLEWALTGEPVSATRASEVGLVNRVVPAGEAVNAAVVLGAAIGARSPAIVGMGKRAFYAIADQSLDDALRFMHGQLTVNLLAEDAAEGVAAFFGKRPPLWKGR